VQLRVLKVSEYSNTIKSTALYLYHKKGKTREEVSKQFSITMEEFDSWVAREKEIISNTKNELTGHLLSLYV
jgi:hypothetical protein